MANAVLTALGHRLANFLAAEIPGAERATTNSHLALLRTIRFNDLVLMPSGFPRTRDAIAKAGFTTCEIGNSECAKLDGGMSCLSLRFTPQ